MMTYIIVCLISVLHVYPVSATQKTNCKTALPHDFSFCHGYRQPCNDSNAALVNNPVCNRTISVATVNIFPHNETLREFVMGLTENCCGSCRYLEFDGTYDGPFEMAMALNNETANYDFIYPVLGYYLERELLGRYFIPFVPARSALFIINQKTKVQIMKDLLTACVNLWPLLTICLFMAFIAGFLGWLMDTWRNVEEFPRPFISGVYEGFWWSFVSMTTVGYGDKSPKSHWARMFSICWILIGITICSMFTASLTNAITEASASPGDHIESKKIGVMNNRLLDPALVIKKSGIVVKETNTIGELFDALDADDIDGILLDSSSAKELLLSFDLTEYIVSEKDFSSDGLAYGALVRDESQYDYFNSFMKDNHVLFETCLNMDKGKHEVDDLEINIFSPSGGLFWPSFAATMVCIFLICVFGFAYEHYRKRKTNFQVETGKIAGKEIDKEEILKQIQDLLIQLQTDTKATDKETNG